MPKIYCRFEHQHIDFSPYFPCTELHITKAMPRWPRALDAEDRLQAALTAWRTASLYKSAEPCAKAHDVTDVPDSFALTYAQARVRILQPM